MKLLRTGHTTAQHWQQGLVPCCCMLRHKNIILRRYHAGCWFCHASSRASPAGGLRIEG